MITGVALMEQSVALYVEHVWVLPATGAAPGGDALDMGLGQSLSALGRAIGPAFAGLLFELHNDLPFWCGSILLMITPPVALSLRPLPPRVGLSPSGSA